MREAAAHASRHVSRAPIALQLPSSAVHASLRGSSRQPGRSLHAAARNTPPAAIGGDGGFTGGVVAAGWATGGGFGAGVAAGGTLSGFGGGVAQPVNTSSSASAPHASGRVWIFQMRCIIIEVSIAADLHGSILALARGRRRAGAAPRNRVVDVASPASGGRDSLAGGRFQAVTFAAGAATEASAIRAASRV